MSVLIESCPTKVFLPNAGALSRQAQSHYQDFGLNEAEIALISSATPKREYYIVQPKGRRLIDLGLGEVALKFLGVNPIATNADNKLFFEYFDPDNPRWMVDYLKAAGLTSASEFINDAYFKEQACV